MSARKRTSRTKVFNVCFLEASKHAKKGHAAFDRALHTCIVRKAGGKAYGGVKREQGQGTRKIRYSKHGLAEDPRGLRIEYRGITGKVIGVRRDYVTGAILLDVQHSNGTPWSFSPIAAVVNVLGG